MLCLNRRTGMLNICVPWGWWVAQRALSRTAHALPAVSQRTSLPPRLLCAQPLLQVLCASNDAHDAVDPIIPPEGAAIGERVTFEG